MEKNKKFREMRIDRLLGNWKVIILFLLCINVFFFLLINYLLNLALSLPLLLQNLNHPQEYLDLSNCWIKPERVKQYSGLYMVVGMIYLIFILFVDVRQAFRMRTAFSASGFNMGQKGKERWTTNEEIRGQYKEIPDRDIPFPGYGGTIVSRIGNNLYLDDSAVNNLIIGITRSGKGEMFVYPSIDVYSRAEKKASMVVTDPKMELYKSCKKTLEERGYEVYLLCLDDPLHSMGFNPLKQCVDIYLKGDYANAELLIQAFSFSIFNPDKPANEDSFWQESASNLLSALILGIIEDCVEQDKMDNQRRKAVWKEKRQKFEQMSLSEKEYIREQYQKISKESGDLVLYPGLSALPENAVYEDTFENCKKINMFSVMNLFSELVRIKDEEDVDISGLDAYFDRRPGLNRAKLKYTGIEISGYRTKSSVFSTMFTKLTIFTYENVGKMTAESSLNIEDIGFGDKPIAVFLGIPDYDKSIHFLASVFIRQMYFVLAKKASNSMSGKCPRLVKVIADEFGNIPAVESMENIITVCLGRNISFDLVIQSYSQLDKLYGDDSKTIRGNCGNHIYILTNDEETAEGFSKLIGNETLIDMQRSGERLSTKKHIMESTIDHPLLDMNRLMNLYPGECVVKRVMKRTDLKGKRVQPTPIFNSEESGKRFLFRYEYLKTTFPDPDMIDLKEINPEDRSHINLAERIWDYNLTFARFNAMEEEENSTLQQGMKKMQPAKTLKDLTNKDQILKSINSVMGITYMPENMTIEQLADWISNVDLKDQDKDLLLNLLAIGKESKVVSLNGKEGNNG